LAGSLLPGARGMTIGISESQISIQIAVVEGQINQLRADMQTERADIEYFQNNHNWLEARLGEFGPRMRELDCVG